MCDCKGSPIYEFITGNLVCDICGKPWSEFDDFKDRYESKELEQ